MNLDDIVRVNFTNLEQEVMKLIRKHCKDNTELEKDLYTLIQMIEEQSKHNDNVRELAFVLANKI